MTCKTAWKRFGAQTCGRIAVPFIIKNSQYQLPKKLEQICLILLRQTGESLVDEKIKKYAKDVKTKKVRKSRAVGKEKIQAQNSKNNSPKKDRKPVALLKTFLKNLKENKLK